MYAVGVLLWEMLTGSQPHAGDAPLTVAYRHVNEDVPPPSTLVGGLPPALDELVVRATRRDPAAAPARRRAPCSPSCWPSRAPAAPPAQRQDTLVVPLRRPDEPTATLPAVPHRRPSSRGPADAGPPPAPAASAAGAPAGHPDGSPRPRAAAARAAALVAALVVLLLALAAGGGGYVPRRRPLDHAPGVLGLSGGARPPSACAPPGFAVREDEARFDEQVPVGAVLDQDPDPRGRVRKGGTVGARAQQGPRPASGPRRRRPHAWRRPARPSTPSASGRPGDRGVLRRPARGAGAAHRPGQRAGAAAGRVGGAGRQQGRRAAARARTLAGRGRSAALAAVEAGRVRAAVQEAFDERGARPASCVSSEPDSGRAPRGSTITVVVSKGPDLVQVPDLRGRSRDEAEQLLEAADLEGRAFDLPDGSGSVVTQSPAAGEQVRRGSTVTYYVL